MHIVVNRVELPIREEVQVLAIRIEGRSHVEQHRTGHWPGLPSLHFAQLDARCVLRVSEAVGHPPPIGRPGYAVNPRVLTPVQKAHRARREVNQDQLVAMIAQDHQIVPFVRVCTELSRSAQGRPLVRVYTELSRSARGRSGRHGQAHRPADVQRMLGVVIRSD